MPETIAIEILKRLSKDGRTTLDLTLDREWLDQLSAKPENVIYRMRKEGLIHDVQRGRYVVNVDGRPSNRPRLDALDPLVEVVLARLQVAYFLSWHSALWHHDLIDQQSSKLFVALCEHRKRPARFPGGQIQFASLTRERFFGFEIETAFGYRLPIATIERAIIDSLARPRLAAPVAVTANALRYASESGRLNVERLVEFAIRFDSYAVNRRLGFFMDFYGIPGSEPLALRLGRDYAVPLVAGRHFERADPPVNSKWRVFEEPQVLNAAESLR